MAERPEYITVPEVMARLRLGRTTVYEQARRYLATNGAEGLPCRRFGRSLWFPAAALDAGTVEAPTRNKTSAGDPTDVRKGQQAAPLEPHARRAPPLPRPRNARRATTAQLSLLDPS